MRTWGRSMWADRSSPPPSDCREAGIAAGPAAGGGEDGGWAGLRAAHVGTDARGADGGDVRSRRCAAESTESLAAAMARRRLPEPRPLRRGAIVRGEIGRVTTGGAAEQTMAALCRLAAAKCGSRGADPGSLAVAEDLSASAPKGKLPSEVLTATEVAPSFAPGLALSTMLSRSSSGPSPLNPDKSFGYLSQTMSMANNSSTLIASAAAAAFSSLDSSLRSPPTSNELLLHNISPALNLSDSGHSSRTDDLSVPFDTANIVS